MTIFLNRKIRVVLGGLMKEEVKEKLIYYLLKEDFNLKYEEIQVLIADYECQYPWIFEGDTRIDFIANMMISEY